MGLFRLFLDARDTLDDGRSGEVAGLPARRPEAAVGHDGKALGYPMFFRARPRDKVRFIAITAS